MARRMLSYGRLVSALSVPHRLVMAFALDAGGRILQAGEDVTDFMRALPESTRDTHIKRGYVRVVPITENEPATPAPIAQALKVAVEQAEEAITETRQTVTSAATEALRALGRRPKYEAFVAALRAAGAEVKPNASYADLIDLRRSVLSDEVAE